MNFDAYSRHVLTLAAVLGCGCPAVTAQQGARPPAEEAALPRKASFGVQVGPVTKETRQRQNLDSTEGVVLVQVFPRTTASEAALMPGDVNLSVNGSKVADTAAFLGKAGTIRTGDMLTLEVAQGGKKTTKKVTMREKPRETSDAYDITYGQVRSRGSGLRTIVTCPKGPGRHPAVFLIQGYGCASIDNLIGELDPYGWLAKDLTLHGFVLMRVDRPGCGDSEGGPCRDVDFETELDGYRQALKTLKAPSSWMPRACSSSVTAWAA